MKELSFEEKVGMNSNLISKLRNVQRDCILKKTVISLFLLYALFIFYAYSHIEAKYPDENWFWGIAQGIHWHHSIKNMLLTQNYLGYGAFYWETLKILHSFFIVRMVWALLALSLPVCISAMCRKIFNFSYRQLSLALILYFSCPLSWFTGKIIGPEILGQALGAWGTFLIIAGYKHLNWQRYLISALGALLIGIAAGIKLYNIVFLTFCAVYVLVLSIRERRYKDFLAFGSICALVFAIGFIHGGGYVMIADFSLYKKSLPQQGGFHADFLPNVLFGKRIEWDLVNSGGMNSTIISVPCCIALVLLSCASGKNKVLSVSCGVCLALSIISCCFSGRFLGWYLLPVIPFLSLLAANCKFSLPILLINLIFMFLPVSYQITSKVIQIENIKNLDTLSLRLQDWQSQYDDSYQKYMFVEIADGIPFFEEYKYKDGERGGKKQLLFISDRALKNRHLSNLKWQAEENMNGYKLIDYKDGIWFITFEVPRDATSVFDESEDSVFDDAEDVLEPVVTE